MPTYRYAVIEERKKIYVDVEMAGRVVVNPGEDPIDKAIKLIVSTQRVDENTIDLQKVADLQHNVVTSDRTPNKR